MKRRGMTALGAVVLAASVALTAPAAASAADGQHGGPVVVTTEGPVRGSTTGATVTFRGLRYAAPPVGELRWRAPAPADRRKGGVLDASTSGPACPQNGSPFGQASSTEDCLFLDVHAPTGAKRPAGLPVMVYFHPGGLLTGRGNALDPAPLVRNGVLVVTVNYRLGALGFLAHPGLSAEADGSSGNFGLMDQQAALRWVQRNIRGFGGDPANVTIFGESAGGQSVIYQMVSPAAAGLFSRAIAQSGADIDVQHQVSQLTANAAGTAFAEAAGCPNQSAACLRALPVAALLAKQRTDFYNPNLDGRVLPQSVSSALTSGEVHRVPFINGSNADEFRLFIGLIELAGYPITDDAYEAGIQAVLSVDGATAAYLAGVYPLSEHGSASEAVAAIGTDAVFSCSTRQITELASRWMPTYAYEFADRTAPPFLPPLSFPQGAYHGSENPYLFAVPGMPDLLNAAQQGLATTMQRYWTSFATTAVPEGRGDVPSWPRYDEAELLQRLALPAPTTTSDFADAHHCDLWTPAS
ncbi:MAG: carboxylesterase family protein [Frankiaceae bacterium]|nr:carboxylesterase family protein [Frankiaceae bacterium]